MRGVRLDVRLERLRAGEVHLRFGRDGRHAGHAGVGAVAAAVDGVLVAGEDHDGAGEGGDGGGAAEGEDFADGVGLLVLFGVEEDVRVDVGGVEELVRSR